MQQTASPPKPSSAQRSTRELDSAVIRFCGDSGDGMQLIGTQFTNVSAAFGNDVSTLPDFPAEIRAPVGTLAGVSGFQLHFSSKDIFTPGDQVDALVVMNPAALKTNVSDLKRGGILIVNEDEFDTSNLDKAAYDSNPLDDPQLNSKYDVHRVPMTRLTRDAVLGLVFWLYERDPAPTIQWLKDKFKKIPKFGDANLKAMQGGLTYGEATEAFAVTYRVARAKLPAGKYRKIMGNEATAWGLVAAAQRCGKKLFFSGYPITPASDILHELSMMKNFGVRTFHAEDEIAAMASVCGAAFAGEIAATASSGPGICLKGEAMGLGVMTELPMVIVDVQRGGPSTGLPTKTEQADLLLAMFGRNSDSPLPIVAASGPADCFDAVQEAVRLAVEFMTPVIFLSDGYIANGSEPWRIPKFADLPPIKVVHPTAATAPRAASTSHHGNGADVPQRYLPYFRNEKGARPWAIPGTPGLEHRIGGIEKAEGTGNIDYAPANHHKMVMTRMNKVANIANHIPLQEVEGPAKGKLLVLSWGGTCGAVRTAVQQAQAAGVSVAHAHLRYMNPFPRNLAALLKSYDKVLIPELNTGHLFLLVRAKFLVDAVGLNKIAGKPFLVHEIVDEINRLLEGK
ncbi:MAG: 2-oxoacid:acceptor oxidoreductase subunit alpha [Planctomycetes bacterium]|nr:2-oxoacid:acceptor oxidoreductase subunit alpha [Planctomycetota bacterium]